MKPLDYHSKPTPGKISIAPTKPLETKEDLSMAYTPGVAEPCLLIKENPEDVYKYTSKSNTVAVITDGTAVLGLGNIGAAASLPVMEGKSVLFKKFADIDSIPLAISEHKDKEEFVSITSKLHSSLGGINLEDIKAPECFYIEDKVKQNLNIPVFHDDQHGTAIIATAALLNSIEITGKNIETIKVVLNGAGAAGIAIGKMFLVAGVKKENIFMLDSKGLIYNGREAGMNEYKEEFANGTIAATLEETIVGADVFAGISVANILTKEMVSTMNENSIIMAMANPNPEIMPDLAKEGGARIIATGRSDFKNQVNNVLGFPGIFRGALDTRSTEINEEMKLAAAKALVEITKLKVPEDVKEYFRTVYPSDSEEGVFDGDNPLSEEYIIPKPFDPRVVPHVARKVAKAAMDSGVAQIRIENLEEYEESVYKRISLI